jgi:hypothetical protein
MTFAFLKSGLIMRFPWIYLVSIFHFGIAHAQLFQPPDYPRTEFGNPLSIPISLAANFGELRSNHFHMGLDIRTAHRENLPVHAAADGFICRVNIEPFGFGQAVYIRHPAGFTTVYAHLNAFTPALEDYVRKKQYALERWAISMDIPPGLFPVKKGDLIAYSGSTGGSEGPHLHFEIRDFSGNMNFNPMLFGLPIADNTAPVFRRLAVYDRNQSIYEQSPVFFAVAGGGSHYSLPAQPLITVHTANVGFGISGFDTQTGSANPTGIFQGIVFDNGRPVSGFRMDRISYNDTRGINAHIDYRTKAMGGPYYQLLFALPGSFHSIYREDGDGLIRLDNEKIHEIRIELQDAYGNKSDLRFKVQYQPGQEPESSFTGKMFYPSMIDGYETEDCAFYLGERSLYDSVHVSYQAEEGIGADLVSRLHHIGSTQVPLADSITVRIRLTKPFSEKSHVLMEWMDKSEFDVRKVEWQGDWATTAFRSFGAFQLVMDTVPPEISFPGIAENANLQRSSRIAVVVRDNYKKIKNFRALLDEHWLLFSNDKGKAFIYHFDEHCPSGRHELKISVEDEAGNRAESVLDFTR